MTSGPSGSETDLLKQVLDILQEQLLLHLNKCRFVSVRGLVKYSSWFAISSEKEYGVHFDEIVKRFRLPERNIW